MRGRRPTICLVDEQSLNAIRNTLSLIRAIDEKGLDAHSSGGRSFVLAIQSSVETLALRLGIGEQDALLLCWRLFLSVYFILGKEPTEITAEVLDSLLFAEDNE